MNIPDCYDPIYQAERLAAEADKKALHCSFCKGQIWDSYWDIFGAILCEECAAQMYRRNVEDLNGD